VFEEIQDGSEVVVMTVVVRPGAIVGSDVGSERGLL
jgi:hypothetical protein